MEYYTPTFQEGRLMTCLRFGYPFTIQPHTTLNEKFDIFPNEQPLAGQYPITSFFTIGTGGRKLIITPSKRERNVHAEYSPTNTALFEHCPFVLRDLDNDLSPAERSKYRGRRLETHNATTKVAYYGLRMIPLSTGPKDEIRTTVDGQTTPAAYLPSVGDLSPVAVYPSVGVTNLTNNSTAVSVGVFNLVIDEQGLEDLREVSSVLYGDPDALIINEIGIAAGIDRTVTVTQPNTSVTYTESVCSIITGFLKTKYEIAYGRTFNEEISLGSDCPLP